MKKLYPLLLLLMLVLSLPLMACGLTGRVREKAAERAAKKVAEVVEPTATPVPEPEKEATPAVEKEPTPTAVPPMATPTAISTPTPASEQPAKQPPAAPSGAAGLIAKPEDALDSYRMRSTMRTQEDDGSWGPLFKMETEWVREPPARHMVMYGESEAEGMEIITIGDTTWMKMGDIWMTSEAGESPEEAGPPVDLESILQEMEGGMTLVGEETVNGVHCKRYTLDVEVSVPLPRPEGAPQGETDLAQEITVHVQGEAWVADQSDLPPVIIRAETQGEMTFKAPSGDRTMVVQEEREVYDINTPITIEPPAEAEEIGAASEFPMMPDAQVTMAMGPMTTYTTASSVKDVGTFYEREMPAAGWIRGETTQIEGLAMMQFTKEGRSVSVMIMPAEEGSGSQVMLTSE